MQKAVVRKLYERLRKVEQQMSSTDRANNYSKETFKKKDVTILSEKSAVAIFEKSTGRQAVCLCFYLDSNNGNGTWLTPFISYGHLIGLRRCEQILARVEMHNLLADQHEYLDEVP